MHCRLFSSILASNPLEASSTLSLVTTKNVPPELCQMSPGAVVVMVQDHSH